MSDSVFIPGAVLAIWFGSAVAAGLVEDLTQPNRQKMEADKIRTQLNIPVVPPDQCLSEEKSRPQDVTVKGYRNTSLDETLSAATFYLFRERSPGTEIRLGSVPTYEVITCPAQTDQPDRKIYRDRDEAVQAGQENAKKIAKNLETVQQQYTRTSYLEFSQP